jgi:ribonucleoside-diphosphate reductase alpha chain
MSIIIQASIAQKYIDQGQSIDINIPSTIATKEVNKLYMDAWTLGIKSLYYQKSESVAKEFINSVMDCHFCES